MYITIIKAHKNIINYIKNIQKTEGSSCILFKKKQLDLIKNLKELKCWKSQILKG